MHLLTEQIEETNNALFLIVLHSIVMKVYQRRSLRRILRHIFNKNDYAYRDLWLALPPLKDKTSQDADEHISFMDFDFCVPGKNSVSAAALIVDSCGKNQAIACKLHFSIIDCAIH